MKPYTDGGSAGYKVPFEEMKTTYYQARGWDPNTGLPSPSKLKELGLEWVHEEKSCV
jgi:aldehyde:ferredoxin oxidoreductase